jgi:hypothetical protein
MLTKDKKQHEHAYTTINERLVKRVTDKIYIYCKGDKYNSLGHGATRIKYLEKQRP